MIRSANGCMPFPSFRMTHYQKQSTGRYDVYESRTHNDYGAEVALKLIPVVAVIHTKYLILYEPLVQG